MNSLSPWIAIGLTAVGMLAFTVFTVIKTWTQVQEHKREIDRLWTAHKECNACVSQALRRIDRFMSWWMGKSDMNQGQIDKVLSGE